MKPPVGLTYLAHAILVFVMAALCAINLSMKLGGLDFTSGQGLGMVVGMLGAIPAGISMLIAAYSAIAVLVTLLSEGHVPREMLLLPIGFLVNIGGWLIGSQTPGWIVVAYVMVASYFCLTITLVAQYLARRRRRA